MSKWYFEDGDPPRLESDFEPVCEFHKKRNPTKLVYLFSHLLRFALRNDGEKEMGNAVDVWFFCPYCGNSQLYGVAVTEDEWEKIYATIREE